MRDVFRSSGLSTALATIVIISVLVLSMSWMAYTVVLNARQQAAAAERAESIALKAKELVRVYIWLDPARQPDRTYLNLTRISFVGAWSGETTINFLLVVYKNRAPQQLPLNIRLEAGEEKTYLPSELGIAGLDNFDAFRAAVKYVQAHTSLGNDFVSLWGRPDKPAVYEVDPGTGGTTTITSTITETVTVTTNTPPPTTTTTTSTPPPTTTTTNTPPPTTTTTTITVTITQTVYTRCTYTDWRYTTVTSWYTSTSYTGAVSTVTSWVTSTVPTTVTVTATVTSTGTITGTTYRYVTVTTTVTDYYDTYTTIYDFRTIVYWYTSTVTVTISYATLNGYDGWGARDNNVCGAYEIVEVAANPHMSPGIVENGVTPELSLAIVGLLLYGGYDAVGRRRGVRRIITAVSSIRGIIIVLLLTIPLFLTSNIGSVLAQTTVTSTVTTTTTVCTTTTTVTYTSTLTQYYTTTTTVTTGGTVTVTSTYTTTRTYTNTLTTTVTTYTTIVYTSTYTYTNTYTTTRTYTWTITSTITEYTTLTTFTTVTTRVEAYIRCSMYCERLGSGCACYVEWT